MAKHPIDMTGRELAHQIGSKPETDWGHQAAKAEFEHRKFVWQKAAVVIAGIALVIATCGVIVGALHLVRLAK